MESNHKEVSMDVAIVGIGLRVPGANSYRQFLKNIFAGQESVKFISEAELIKAGVSEEALSSPGYVPAISALSDIEYFDPAFFGLSHREAAVMDPQHRHFLEICYEALESAGYSHRTKEFPVGVFAGCGYGYYLQQNVLGRQDLIDELGWFYLRHTGNDKDFLATRVAYELELRGPAVNIQTACSTSLVATHYACNSLLSGECDIALAGGVSIELPKNHGYATADGDIASTDGHCKPFSADSTGTIFGSGAAVLTLKRFDDAIDDRDYIYAVVKGSAVNNDGRNKVGFFAPGVEGHAAAASDALDIAGVDPESIGLIEAHGTGTYLGDPVEVRALSKVYSTGTNQNSIALGSVKSNIGHLDTAAGVVGLIKAMGAVEEGIIPPTLHSQNPNPEIDFVNSPFFLPQESLEWMTSKRRAGVSSLGVGGTNAHIIIENFEEEKRPDSDGREFLVQISARDPLAFQRQKNQYIDFLKTDTKLEFRDICYTLNTGRSRHPILKTYIAKCKEELLRVLEKSDLPGESRQDELKKAFLFAGGGAQRYDFAIDLLKFHQSFREPFEECARHILNLTGVDLNGGHDATGLPEDSPIRALPFLFACQYSFACFLESLGIVSDCLVGHSMGEYTAACLAEIFSVEDTLRIIVKRAELFGETEEGRMLSACMTREEAESYCSNEISLAADNASELVVFSGAKTAVKELSIRLSEKGINCDMVRINVAAHSHLLEPVLDQFEAFVEGIYRKAPVRTIYSNVTGGILTAEEAVSARYWRRHLRETVQFRSCVETMIKNGVGTFIEIGPGKVLASLVRAVSSSTAVQSFSGSFSGHESAYRNSLSLLGMIAEAGIPINWNAYLPDSCKKVPLPTYPFARERCWLDARSSADVAAGNGLVRSWQESWKTLLRPGLCPSISEDISRSFILLGESRTGLAEALSKHGRVYTGNSTSSELTEGQQLTIVVQIPAVTEELSAFELYSFLRKTFLDNQNILLVARSVVCLSNGAFSCSGESIIPAARVVSAFAAVLSAELGVAVSSIDSNGSTVRLAQILAAMELETSSYAVRNEALLRREFSECVLPEVEGNFQNLEQGTICIVTGAFGSLGGELVKVLATRSDLHLILLARRTPCRKTAAEAVRVENVCEELDAAKSSYEVLSTKDSLAGKLRAVLERSAYQTRPVALFHCAGLLNDSLLSEKAIAKAREVFESKIELLLGVLAGIPEGRLKQGVLFSSISSFIGAPGQSDYASANAVLEGIADVLRRTGANVNAVLWGPWSSQGMAARIVNGGELLGVSAEGLLPRLVKNDSFTFSAEFTLNPDDWIVAEHEIPGVGKVLPGTGILECVLEAFKGCFGFEEITFQDVFFMRPVLVEKTTFARVTLETSGDEVLFSFRVDEEEFATGSISKGVKAGYARNLASLYSIAKSKNVPLSQRDKIRFGQRWQSINGAYVEKGELRAVVTVPEQDLNARFVYHPGALDAALFGTLSHIMNLPQIEGIYAPISIETAAFYTPLPRKTFLAVKGQVTSEKPASILLSGQLESEDGSLIAVFENMRLQEVSIEKLCNAAFRKESLNTELKPAVSTRLKGEMIPTRVGLSFVDRVLGSNSGDIIVSRKAPAAMLEQQSFVEQSPTLAAVEIERLVEVETILTMLPQVVQALIVRKDGSGRSDGRVLAYVQFVDDDVITNTDIRAHLVANGVAARNMPIMCIELSEQDFAVVNLSDLDDLPDPFLDDGGHEPPVTEPEQYVAASWSKLLGVRTVGRFDSFLDIGGHSLLALRFIQMVRREKGVMLDPGTLVVQNVMQIAELLEENSNEEANLEQKHLRRSFKERITQGLRRPFKE